MKISDWTIDDSRARGCKRWGVYPSSTIDLTVAEMDFPVAEPIQNAVQDAVGRQAFGYPIPDSDSTLPAVASQWLGTQGVSVPPQQVRLISDIIKGLTNAIRYFTAPGTPVAVITPTYSRFLDAITAAERLIYQVPMTRKPDRYELDLDALENAFKNGSGSLILCNPVNPTGHVFTRSELTAISDLAERYRIRVFADEVHAPIRYGREFIPYSSIGSRAAEHSITFTSASKAWNIPGLRCAFIAFTNEADNRTWERIPRAAKGGISPLGMVATEAALTSGGPWLTEAIEVLRGNRDAMVTALSENGLGHIMIPPDATYLAWLDLREFELSDAAEYLRDTAAVATTPGGEHGAVESSFVRVNFATPRDILLEAVDRMTSALLGTRQRDTILGEYEVASH
ncbi:MalY/PatB family protein [Microbacterium sp. MPKO10]|uniref:MalY/PatB family protein n=1 Tax=Microbacterium sp. MPKO10 TaxID=2989818 RepID=UPI0022358F43|nr:aminotransferase class I/II-fold pyridoxal phosphate-dependent enzyme [Microbacterium sp. MPKO10]MCW4457913.1 aminotransferase class I/II-fold pyridoxal phosphate-dependent enzyme [Microbacterium sp. MPKO10]